MNNLSISQGNTAFRNGDYDTAKTIYESLLPQGGVIKKIAEDNLRLIAKKTGNVSAANNDLLKHRNIKPIIDSLKSSDGNLIITYPIIPWAFRIQRPQHLVARLSKNGYTSLYIANVAPPAIPTTDQDILDCLGTHELSAGVHEIWLQTEQGFNMYKSEIIGNNLHQLTRQLKVVCDLLKPKKIIHLVQFPGWSPLAEKVKQELGGLIVYDCMDHHAGFTNNTGEALSQESKLIKNADLVLASSLLLEKELKPRAKDVLLVKNATEFEHFKSPRPNGKLDHLNGPIIGYYGAIADWFDIELVVEIAKRRPDWCFVLIGSTDLCDTSEASKLSNIYFFGEIPYKDLPGYFSYFDVCTIPFKIIPLTEATNPVKFYEYISAGKPVVTTALPELHPYSEFVYFASNAEQFIDQIEKSLLSKDDKSIKERRQALAENNDWNARAKTILENDSFKARVEKYRFSIVIVTYNELEDATKPCIDSILENTPSGEYELIVVDNLSTKDGTREYLQSIAKKHAHLKIRLNDENRGFSGGNNDGLRMSSGEFIVLLNNDTIVKQGWLDRLFQPLYHDPKIGLIGPITNSAGGSQKIEVGNHEPIKVIQSLEQYSSRNRQVIYEAPKLGFFCVGFRAKLLDEVGFLDEAFGVGMFEDDEFCHRVKSVGYKCVINEGCYVYHKGSASFSKLKTNSYQELFEKNRKLFKEKTSLDWSFSSIMQEYIGYMKYSISQALSQPDRALSYLENISLRYPSLEWIASHIGNIEVNCASGSNVGTSTGTNTRPRSITSEEVLNHFGRIRNEYIKNKKVVVFPPTVDWNYMTQRPQQLAKAFVEKDYAVIYCTFCAQEDSVDFYEITEDGILILNQAFLVYMNHLIAAEETLYFCIWPTNLHYAETIPHTSMVYDIIDDICLLQGDPERLKSLHLESMQKADLITVSANLLKDKIPEQFAAKTALLPNGVSDNFIMQAKQAMAQDQFDNINLRDAPEQKVVGYVGAIAEWMDFGLIEELLSAFPEVKFVFVGPLFSGGNYIKTILPEHSNLVLIPEKKHYELPAIIAQFDVCIIPFLLNKITHAVSPVKLFEYAAFGKPIVTTAMRECKSYPVVSIARDHAEFLSIIKRELYKNDGSINASIVNLAHDNTWIKRVDHIVTSLQNH